MKIVLTITLVSIFCVSNAQTKFIDSLQRVVALQRHDTVELEALLNLTNEFLRKDLAVAKQYSLKAKALADAPHEIKWLGGAYNYLITIYQQSGNLDSATYMLEQAKELVGRNPGHVKLRYNYNQAAGLYYKNTGEFKRALPYMLDNKKIWTKEDENRAGLLLNLGNLYHNLGQYKDAADHHLQALMLFEKLKVPRGESYCLQSLGNDFFNLGQLATARKYYEQSLQLKEKLQDPRGALNSTISLADVYKDMNEFQKAETLYQKALASAKNLKFPGEEARVLHQSGLLYRRMGDAEKARESFSTSMAISKEIGDKTTYAVSQSELLNLDLAEQNKKKTETLMLEGLNTLIQTGDRQQEALEYSRLSEYYESEKNFEKALYFLKKHEALTDSVEGNAVLVQLKELEEKYKSDKQQQEIALLKKEQELSRAEVSRQRANLTIIFIALISVIIISLLLVNRYRVVNRSRRMIELERMRNHIARDLHDDIGSTLSSINIMSQLALKEQGDAGGHLKKIATHSARMMENMSDIVWSINPNNDSLEQMTAKMKEFAAEILEPKDIDYRFEIDPSVAGLTLDVEKRKNVFLIFKEAINNAAKYSEAKTMSIQIVRENGSLNLAVKDDGRGFDTSSVATGNGLKNMADRARSMKGSLIQTSEPGKGCSLSLQVPIT